ncbi:ABC transporter ATP-binding protein [Streptomyces sp. CBMA156]|uniref:ABC transporter ATP-binding protein n=1 Tax=Streptomyces sp. CBMA156 TaxID=1930280 RepID=UPI001661C696|nr:ABC transporter ATP-binding protein [Streptomyces sp. CBMA156]MBD0670811.1 multidrug ABC transporter ATP-binding protein [Streptomyces sp. CBMA156]
MTAPTEAARGLPVAGAAEARRAAVRLVREDGRAVVAMLALNGLAAAAGLGGPWLLGRIIDDVRAGAGTGHVDRLALGILCFALAQLLLGRFARYAGYRFGERTLARIRERFVERALALPASVVERAGTGDLMTRGTADVATVGTTLRDAAPEVSVALVQVVLIMAAMLAVDLPLGVCGVLCLSGIWFATRWYLRRAHAGYLAEGAADSALAEVLGSTAAGARTVEALGLEERRIAAAAEAIENCRATRTHTLNLRSVLFPVVEFSYVAPVAGILLIGGALRGTGAVGIGAVVSCALYVWQLAEPMDKALLWLDQLQRSNASFARVEGVGRIDAPVVTGGARPADDRIDVVGVRYAYQGERDVLHGVDLTVRPGERLAVVGPSGAGKSTLGRLLAGAEVPRTGRVTVGRVPVAELDPAQLRRHVVLVSQEHHVFLGTVRDNLGIAAPTAGDRELRAALAAVGGDWVDELPDGLDTALGAGGHRPDAQQAQQLALARVVLADPHTVILDEATSLLDPATARHTERSLAAVLRGRTVIAIAHRLHTAHDADRVAVMDGGRVTELGSHDELLAADGGYAALWRSWHGG